MKAKLCVFIVGAALCVNAQAAVVVDFTGQGTLYDGKTSVLVDLFDGASGVNFKMTVVGIGGNLNSNSGDFGVGDDIIDFGEAIHVSFSSDVLISSIDLGGVEASLVSDSDRGSVSFASGAAEFFYTDRSDFNGTTDVWTLDSPYYLSAGELVKFTPDQASAEFDLEKITITAVPEPSSTLLLGMGGLAVLSRRKRTHCIRMLPNG